MKARKFAFLLDNVAYQFIKGAKASKQEASIKPPTQPQMPQSLGGGVAFDSAPVIDSSDYHNL